MVYFEKCGIRGMPFMSQGTVAAVLGFGSTEKSLPTFQLGILSQACLRAGRGISQSKE